MKLKSLQSLSVILTATLSVAFMGMMLYIYFQYRSQILTEALTNIDQKLETAIAKKEKYFSNVQTIGTNVRDIVSVLGKDDQTTIQYFRRILQTNKNLIGISIAYSPSYIKGHDLYLPYVHRRNKTDEIDLDVLNEDNYGDYRTIDWYQVPMMLDTCMWCDPYYSDINKTIDLTYSLPFKDPQGVDAGVLLLDVELDDVTKTIFGDEHSGTTFVAGRRTEFLLCTQSDKILIETMYTMAEIENDERLKVHADAMLRGEDGHGEVKWDGKESYLVYRSLKGLNWTAGVIINTDDIYSEVYVLTWMQVGMALVFIIIIFLIFTTIKMMKKNNMEISLALQKAENADQMKSIFLANMSHEIRTPLNAIIGFTDILLNHTEDVPEEERPKLVDLVMTNNDILLMIINDILDLSKIESGMYIIKHDRFAIDQACFSATKSLESQVPDGVRLEYNCSCKNLFIYGDEGRIKQVLMQFISNACKHIQAGYIRVVCERVRNTVKISVIDTGEGIAKEEQELVFERFYKGKSQAKGTGLGLAICQKLVTLWDGEIGVESELGRGSCFWFTIPI
ncbi:MAG: sensor histidine kinase [Bacteroidia bacterium]|nr:sensor histidine kinase [Bacteroidia bacterium]